MGIISKLSPRDRKLFKLAVWTCLVVWIVFFEIMSVAVSVTARYSAEFWYPVRIWGNLMGPIMSWVIPVWIIFTSLIIVILVSRLAKRKLS